MNLSPEKKIAGVLAPLFALRGKDDLGVGDVAALREFIDWAAEIGFKLVQLLPINETSGDNSPYNAISAMALEPTTLHLAPASPKDLTRQNFFRYVQWIGHEQWREMKSYAAQRDVALMGDVPFGVSYYSADVFARADEFALDWSGGAPPELYFKDDQFTQKWGQNWGIPLYRWDRMRANNFDWWRVRVRAVRRIFHLFRIDHVLGFYRIY